MFVVLSPSSSCLLPDAVSEKNHQEEELLKEVERLTAVNEKLRSVWEKRVREQRSEKEKKAWMEKEQANWRGDFEEVKSQKKERKESSDGKAKEQKNIQTEQQKNEEKYCLRQHIFTINLAH